MNPHKDRHNHSDTGEEHRIADSTAGPGSSARPIRSYVTRATRMSPLQVRSLRELSPLYAIEYQDRQLDPAVLFPTRKDRPVVLEIGFGMGHATAAIARANPDVNYLGIEVHKPGVGKLLSVIHKDGLDNLRVIRHDAVEVLEHMIAPETLAGVHVFFPDPWPKKRHHKRRLLQPGFVRLLVTRMKPGAVFHAATDWAEYADQILEVCEAVEGLQNIAGSGFAGRPEWRPETAFERKGLAADRSIREIIFTRIAGESQ